MIKLADDSLGCWFEFLEDMGIKEKIDVLGIELVYYLRIK